MADDSRFHLPQISACQFRIASTYPTAARHLLLALAEGRIHCAADFQTSLARVEANGIESRSASVNLS